MAEQRDLSVGSLRIFPSPDLKNLSSLLDKEVLNVEEAFRSDFNRLYRLQTPHGECILKQGASDRIQAEIHGLELIAKASPDSVPKIYKSGSDFILMEYVSSSPADESSWRTLGQRLAQIHRDKKEHPGLERDGFIGNSAQKNIANKLPLKWPQFFWSHRIEFQLKMLLEKDRMAPSLVAKIPELKAKLVESLGEVNEDHSLLHGDLWSGNVLFSKANGFFIDPAVYYGHRETDLAMAELFGGFPDTFWESYAEAYPFDEKGYTTHRRPIYQLYHVLNHWNLFGDGYKSRSLALIEDILKH